MKKARISAQLSCRTIVVLLAVTNLKSHEKRSKMPVPKAALVLVHGGWHNHSAWDDVTPILAAEGLAAFTLDLPGAGVNAIDPRSLGARPFDLAAFSVEPSPVASLTQEERTQAVVPLVEQAAALGDGKVVLVGHSAGGMTISAVAEQVPDRLAGLVYLAGFMVPNGMPLLAMLQHETMSSALSPGLFVGDPMVVGATRINTGPADEAYRSLLKASFYADVSEAAFAKAASQLHCDESNVGAVTPSGITPERFGTVPRHYIRCTEDRAVPLAGQDHMIVTVDRALAARQSRIPWKAATRRSCHNRPPWPRFSSTSVTRRWWNGVSKHPRSQSMETAEFEDRVKALRPRLHRYCARMTGSAIDGEDVLQDALVKALHARAQGMEVSNLDGWLFRIAHNESLDFLRFRSRNNVVPLSEDVEAASIPDADIASISFRTFLRLPELQRCAVILKDVLGHSVDEIASIVECSPAAAKSALQRGRVALRQIAHEPEDARLPLMSDADRRKISAFVDLFKSGGFDKIRDMLADDVKLELINRLQWEGSEKIASYFTRYAEESRWRFALGAVEGQPAMLVFDRGAMEKPAHFVWSIGATIEFRESAISCSLLMRSKGSIGCDWPRGRQNVVPGDPFGPATSSIHQQGRPGPV